MIFMINTKPIVMKCPKICARKCLTRATRAFNIACEEVEGYEADVSSQPYRFRRDAGGQVTIISSDKILCNLLAAA